MAHGAVGGNCRRGDSEADCSGQSRDMATGHGRFLAPKAAQPVQQMQLIESSALSSRGAARRQHRHHARKREVEEEIAAIDKGVGAQVAAFREELGELSSGVVE